MSDVGISVYENHDQSIFARTQSWQKVLGKHREPVSATSSVGEYLATATTSDWYKVELVVHCPFEAEFAAEVYAVRVDHMEVMKEAFKG
jgi:hypothetical protein